MGPVAQADGGYVASALPRPQLDQIGRDPASAHEKTADRNRQSEAARTSASRIDEQDAVLLPLLGSVGMAGDHRPEPRRRGADVELVDIVKHEDEGSAGLQ